MSEQKKDLPDLRGLTIHHRQLTELSGYNEKIFRDLALQGYFPSPHRGIYELLPTLRGFFRYLREQAQKNNRPGREDRKDAKLELELTALRRQEDIEQGKLLTLDEWRTVTSETIPPIVQLISQLFRTEIPANCSGQTEARIRVWATKREAEIRRDLRKGEAKFDPAAVVEKRKAKN